jgi:hypothetical protein
MSLANRTSNSTVEENASALPAVARFPGWPTLDFLAPNDEPRRASAPSFCARRIGSFQAGLMFGLSRKKLSGSYVLFSAANRS